MNVEREIPLDILNKIGTEYYLSGGTIRVAKGYDGAGQIVRHFIFPSDPQAAEKAFNEIQTGIQQSQNIMGTVQKGVLENNRILQSVQSLQHMTIALQGINLAVSAVGFAIVINKLNQIAKKIDQLDQKIDLVLNQVKDLKHYHDCIQLTKLTATLKNLESALRINDKALSLSIISRLRESQELFMLVCRAHIDNNIKGYFTSQELFNQHYQGALASSFAIANAFAQLGEIEEALIIINSTDIWQSTIKQSLKDIVFQIPPPVWLGQLTKQQQKMTQQSLTIIKHTDSALEYFGNTYQICIDEKIDINQIINNDKELLILTPRNSNKKYLPQT